MNHSRQQLKITEIKKPRAKSRGRRKIEMVRKEMLTVSLMTDGYPIDGKPKDKAEKMHPEIWKRYAIFFAVIAMALAVVIGYFALSTQTPAKTSGGMMGGGEVQQPAENAAVNAVVNTATTQTKNAQITSIISLIAVPINIQTTESAILVDNPPKIIKVSGDVHPEVYLTNIIFTKDGFSADIENRYTGTSAQGFKKILLDAYGIPGEYRIWYTDDPKKALIIPAGQKFRFNAEFNTLSEQQKSIIKTAFLKFED